MAAFLSSDLTLTQEILDGVDLHTDNQQKFGLPSRLIAKVLNFRILYGGNEFSFANDPEFTPISKSEKYWKEVIAAYYNKYKGIKQWHSKIIREVVETGKMTSPLGREYRFQKYNNSYKDTQIKNFSVQGTGADLMSIARVSAFNRIKKLGYGDQCLFVNTVHDSIILDYNEKICDTNVLIKTFEEVFIDLPKNVTKLFGIEFKVPMACECQQGVNWKNMEVVHAN